MARNFSEPSAPDLGQNSVKPLDTSNLQRGLEAKKAQDAAAMQGRQAYADKFKVTQMQVGSKTQAYADESYMNVLNTSVALEDAIMQYGTQSEQAKSLKKQFDLDKMEYTSFSQKATELNTLLTGVESMPEGMVGDPTMWKATLGKKLEESGLTEKVMNGEMTMQEMEIALMTLNGGEAFDVIGMTGVDNAVLGSVANTKEVVQDFVQQYKAEGGSIDSVINKKQFRSLRGLVVMDGGKPKLDEDGNLVANFESEQDIKDFLRIADTTGRDDVFKAAKHEYDQRALEAEKRGETLKPFHEDFKDTYELSEKMGEGIKMDSNLLKNRSTYDLKVANEGDYNSLFDTVHGSLQGMMKGAKEEDKTLFNQSLSIFKGAKLYGQDGPVIMDAQYLAPDEFKWEYHLEKGENGKRLSEQAQSDLWANKNGLADKTAAERKEAYRQHIESTDPRYQDRIKFLGEKEDDVAEELETIVIGDNTNWFPLTQTLMQRRQRDEKKEFTTDQMEDYSQKWTTPQKRAIAAAKTPEDKYKAMTGGTFVPAMHAGKKIEDVIAELEKNNK